MKLEYGNRTLEINKMPVTELVANSAVGLPTKKTILVAETKKEDSRER